VQFASMMELKAKNSKKKFSAFSAKPDMVNRNSKVQYLRV